MKMKTKFALGFLLLASLAYATDAKISALNDGKPAVLADQIPINRAGTNYRLSVDDINGEHCTKSVSDATTTSLIQITVASGAGTSGRIHLSGVASDGTDYQAISVDTEFAAINKAGTLTCPTPTAIGSALTATSTGSISCTFACSTGANLVNFRANCDAVGITPNSFSLYTHVELVGAGTPTCL